MALLTPPDPSGFRAICNQPWFLKPTLTPGATSIVVTLPVALAYYHVVGLPNWNTTVYCSAQTFKVCTLRFGTAIPAGGELLVMVYA